MSEPPKTAQSQQSERSAGGDGGADETKSVKSAKGKTPSASRLSSTKSIKSHKSSAGAGREIPSPVQSAKDNPAADLRNMRRIIAEDPDWSLATVPLLVELCVKHIVNNFESKLYA